MNQQPVSRRLGGHSGIWGGLLILLGVLALMNPFFPLSGLAWVVAFGAAGVVCLVVYFADRARWPALIPAFLLMAISVVIFLEEVLRVRSGSLPGILVVLAIAAPFYVLYAADTARRWWALIPAYFMTALAGIVFLEAVLSLPEALTGTYVMFAIALPFLYVYVRSPRRWWALIPAYVMMAIAGIILLDEIFRAPESLIGMCVMFAIAAPFLFVYVRSPRRWWALIPAYVMMAIAGIILLDEILRAPESLIGMYVMFAIAAPFLLVYLRNPRRWWALVVALGMAALGVLIFLSSDAAGYVVPIAMIAAGAFVLLRSRSRRAPVEAIPAAAPPAAEKPASGPEADQG